MRPYTLLMLTLLLLLAGCRTDEPVPWPEPSVVQDPAIITPDQNGYMLHGFYLLNEGNMGTNKSTLDYMDFASGQYIRNIYATANPDVPMEMGDVGNDLAVYGSRLWAVINCSNKVEVMDAATTRRLGSVTIPNCRSICFLDGYAYITSYAGPVQIDPDYRQTGFVAKVDTATLEEVGRCMVGYQPDGICTDGKHLYVANSGGYMKPNYDNRLSIINISTFTLERNVTLAINLDLCLYDGDGGVWVSSRGDYYGREAKLMRVDTRSLQVTAEVEIPVSAVALHHNKLYVIGLEFNEITGKDQSASAIIDARTGAVLAESVVDTETLSSMKKPYGIAVNPVSNDIYITDAGNYILPGKLYCFASDGQLRWNVRTGDIPAHFSFYATIQSSNQQ